MRTIAPVAVALLLSGSSANGESFDRPVTSIGVDKEGVYSITLRHWDGHKTIFSYPAEFVVLGEVENVAMSQERYGYTYSAARLKVLEVLVCPGELVNAASRIRYLRSEACNGLAVGDSVLVFMTRYEGHFSTPKWYGANTCIGYKLHQSPQFCDDEEFVELVRSGHAWDLEALGQKELGLWRCVDSVGLLGALIYAWETVGEGRGVQATE